MVRKVVLSIYKIYNAPGVAGSWVSAIQGPGVQFHAPKTDVYFVLETSLCCHSVQLSHDELSVRISAAGRGLAAQMDLLRASAVTQLSPTPLTSPRSRSSRSVTAYKPTSHSAQHKRSTARHPSLSSHLWHLDCNYCHCPSIRCLQHQCQAHV
jgi:hypothetical protein